MQRNDFKMLDEIIYLDTAAGSLKPQQVVDATTRFYNHFALNPHSIESPLGTQVAKTIQATRQAVARLIDAKPSEIIFNSGTTAGSNTLATTFKSFLKPGDEILVSYLNHSAMIVPWMNLAKETGAKIIFKTNVVTAINPRTKIVAIAQMNNSLDYSTKMAPLAKLCRTQGIILVNDAAQAIAHQVVSLKNADAIIFSTNKLYGPTGLGVLAIRTELLKKLKSPVFGGGGIAYIDEDKWIAHAGNLAFEVGTPNTAALFGLQAALEYLDQIGWNNIFAQLKMLADYCYQQLKQIPDLIMYSKRNDHNLIFNIKGANAQDVVSYLGRKNIILRAGHLCTKLIKHVINVDSVIRASFGLYNTKADIDLLVQTLKAGGDFLEFI